MKSKRKVLLALTINKQYFIRGIVRYAHEHITLHIRVFHAGVFAPW